MKKWLFIGVDVVLVALATFFAFEHYHSHNTAKEPTKTATTAPAPNPTPSPAVTPADPLTIAAIAARTYPGSAITTTQDLGEQSGYHNTIISFVADGFTEYSLLSIPDGAKPAAGWPVIIFNHGYINPAAYQTNGPEYKQFIATFAQAGYAVLKLDYRGHGQSQGVPDGGHFSPDYAYDELNLIASIKQDSRFDAKRIGLFAHSLGGHTALRTIVVNKDVKATVMMAGVVGSFSDLLYNWPNSPMAGDQPAIVQTNKQILLTKYGDPKANPMFWDSASAINFVKNISGVVQINQDVADSTVPKLFADKLNAALMAAGIGVEYNQYPGDDHQFSANRTALLQKAVAFYKAHL